MATFTTRSGKGGRRVRAEICLRNVRASQTFATKKEAVRWADDVEAGILDGIPLQTVTQKVSGKTTSEFMLQYSNDYSGAKGGAEVEEPRFIKLAKEKVFQTPISLLTTADLTKYMLDRLNGRNGQDRVTPDTFNREMRMVSKAIKVSMRSYGAPITVNPFSNLEWPKDSKPRKQLVSSSDKAMMMAALAWDGFSQPCDTGQWTAFAFSLGLTTSMRLGEMCGMLWKHVDFDGRSILLPHTKNGEAFQKPLTAKGAAVLRILKQGSPDSRVIPHSSRTISNMFSRTKGALGLKIRFHDSRCQALTTIGKTIKSPFDFLRISGHKDLKTASRYVVVDANDVLDKLDAAD